MDDLLVKDIQKGGRYTDTLKMLPDGKGWLLVEFGGDSKHDADDKASALMAELGRASGAPAMKLCEDAGEARQLWKVREYGLGATAHVTEEQPTWPGWEDSAVPPEKLGTYLRRFRALLDRHGYIGDLYGHFGQG